MLLLTVSKIKTIKSMQDNFEESCACKLWCILFDFSPLTAFCFLQIVLINTGEWSAL